jgi:hypothetical protein
MDQGRIQPGKALLPGILLPVLYSSISSNRILRFLCRLMQLLITIRLSQLPKASLFWSSSQATKRSHKRLLQDILSIHFVIQKPECNVVHGL